MIRLVLGGSLTTTAGDLNARATTLTFVGTGAHILDTGGQKITTLIQLGAGTVEVQSSPLIVTGDLDIADGELDSGAEPVQVGGTALIAGAYNAGTAAQTFAGGLIVDGAFNASNQSGTITAAGVTLAPGASMTAPPLIDDSGNWTDAGGAFADNTGTVAFTGSTTQQVTSGGDPFYALTHSGSGSLVLDDDLTVAQDFTNAIGAGSVTATGRTIRVGRNWTWGNSGSFASSGSTVLLTGSSQQIAGNTTFDNLSKSVSQTATLTFAAGSTQTVTGTLTLQGTAGNPLLLRSSVPGKTWAMHANKAAVAFVDVADSVSSSTIAAATSHNSGDNTRWVFAADADTWTGAISSDWNNAGNWSSGYVPNAIDTVVIAAAPNEPVLSSPVAVTNLTLQSGAVLSLAGQALTVTGKFTNDGTLVLHGSEAISLAGGNDTGAGTWEYVGDNTGATIPLKQTAYYNLVIDDTNARADTFKAAAALAIKGSLTVAAGTLNAGSDPMVSVAGLAITGGQLIAPTLLLDSGNSSDTDSGFTAGKGTVTLTAADPEISGSTVFFNLTKVAAGAGTLTFQAGSTQTVLGNLTLHGASTSSRLALRSSATGTPWQLDLHGTASVSLVDVEDSDADGNPITALASKDSGDDTHWVFA